MKTIHTFEERNAVVETNLPLIDKVMKEHHDIVRAARMEKTTSISSLPSV